MRKWLFIAAVAFLLLFTLSAQAEIHVLDEVYGTIDIPETYPIVITPKNLDVYATWLENHGKDPEATRNDLISRGVLLQCWAEDENTCLEITAVQNDRTIGIFNVNQQSEDMRASYRLSHYPATNIWHKATIFPPPAGQNWTVTAFSL